MVTALIVTPLVTVYDPIEEINVRVPKVAQVYPVPAWQDVTAFYPTSDPANIRTLLTQVSSSTLDSIRADADYTVLE